MSHDLKTTLNDAVKTAMRAKDKPRLGVLRMATAAIKQREIDEQITLDDTQVLAVLDKMVKQRRDAAAQYLSAERPELAEQEQYEIQVLQDFLPKALSDEELEQLVADTVSSTGATGMANMGKVMASVKAKVQGRADMSQVSAKVKARLSS